MSFSKHGLAVRGCLLQPSLACKFSWLTSPLHLALPSTKTIHTFPQFPSESNSYDSGILNISTSRGLNWCKLLWKPEQTNISFVYTWFSQGYLRSLWLVHTKVRLKFGCLNVNGPVPIWLIRYCSGNTQVDHATLLTATSVDYCDYHLNCRLWM